MSGNKRIKILIINSHPIQYFAPLYRELARIPSFTVKVLYCSRHGLSGEMDKQFGTSVQWDIPLLDGYDHVFLKNYALKPSIDKFWGLLNLSVLTHLWAFRGNVVIINGWSSATSLLAIAVARLLSCRVCLRGDSSYIIEKNRNTYQLKLRKILLGKGLFNCIDFFLCIGVQNKKFYKYYGVDDSKLIHCPFAVDNNRFRYQYNQLQSVRAQVRTNLGIEVNDFVIVYSGKYTHNKRPLDLLKAVNKLGCHQISVLLVGEGASRQEMHEYLEENGMKKVVLVGFVNQSRIGRYYAAADLYVMCSEIETWGLSTNEAMNFGLPLILSDTIGCAADLLHDCVNGYTYPCRDVDQLAQQIQKFIYMDEERRREMGRQSLAIVETYSYATTINNLRRLFVRER